LGSLLYGDDVVVAVLVLVIVVVEVVVVALEAVGGLVVNGLVSVVKFLLCYVNDLPSVILLGSSLSDSSSELLENNANEWKFRIS